MATISEFGTAQALKQEGFRGIGIVIGTDEEVLGQFFGENVRLVRGTQEPGGLYEYFVMVDGSEEEQGASHRSVVTDLVQALESAHRFLRKHGYDVTQINQAIQKATSL